MTKLDSPAIHLQRGNERFLRDVGLAELPHLLLAFLPFLQKLALAREIGLRGVARAMMDSCR
jgi:hypothetical protein